MNYFDDKRIQCSDKITTNPHGYFNNNSSINIEIKNNIVKLNKIDNSGIIINDRAIRANNEIDMLAVDVNKLNVYNK